MREEKRAAKRQAIAEAAYALIEEKGYLGTSMLAIAKRAKASNETLYNWYGDKQGLFRELIEQNAQQVRDLLQKQIEKDLSPVKTLKQLAPELLTLLLGDRAVALNRAAAADPTGELGKILSRSGKESIFPLIVSTFSRFPNLSETEALDAAICFLDLLVGDQQIRRAIGATKMPTKDEIETRSARALASIKKLYNLN